MPKQRIGWDDFKVDYEEFSGKISDAHFPRNHYWLMVGPTGPRRLRLAIEHLANFRGSSCYFVDLDPRWVKKVIADQARRIGREVSEVRMRGGHLSFAQALQYDIANRLVFSKLKQAIGLSRAHVLISGAAPIAKEVLEYFASLDIVVREVYGQSEGCGPTSVNRAAL